jgi:hypothetical protein
MSEVAYPVTERTKLRRLHERARYDHAGVHAILDAAMVCHIAYVIDGQPYCTPTSFWREGSHLYWHGSSASRMLRAQKQDLPVCLTVTHTDGLVLARSGFNHSINYRSAMCFGTAHSIDDPAEKSRALEAMIDRFYPGRAALLRENSAQDLKATTLLGMTIEQASGKIRAKGVADDEEDYALPIWAGVIPVRQVVGSIETCPRVLQGVAVPAGLAGYAPGRQLDEVFTATHRARFGEED